MNRIVPRRKLQKAPLPEQDGLSVDRTVMRHHAFRNTRKSEYGGKRYPKKTAPRLFLPYAARVDGRQRPTGTGWIVSMRHGDDAAGGLWFVDVNMLECE